MDMSDFLELMDHLQENLYVTDIDTHEILFMNRKMKELYDLHDAEGKICWQVLQQGQSGPCAFCPIIRLREEGQLYKAIVWREKNARTNRTFENHDSLIRWRDGRVAHMQQATDITHTEILNYQANVDDLSGLLNRRSGNQRLFDLMNVKRENAESFTIALVDVNNLKQVNDTFGHREGDFLLKEITSVLSSDLNEGDFAFRLGGDEFVLVFNQKNKKEANRYLLEKMDEVRLLKQRFNKLYEFSYSFGVCEIHSDEVLSVHDVIAKADEQMYQEKLRYRRTQMVQKNEGTVVSTVKHFEYNPAHLYDALITSTDDFVYICNMKTGIFRYSPAQVKVFDLPGEIIENPLPFWKEIVHPQDWERFYKSNMEIGEKTDYHSVEFRARNAQGEYIWLKCRGQLMRDEFGEPELFAGIMTQLDRQNKIDSLTHLYNRQEYIKAFESKVKDRAIDNLGVMIIDIDDFKHVNELYDRSFGDFILKTVAQIIQGELSGNANIYRLDNDQLGILFENTSEEEMRKLYVLIQDQLMQHDVLLSYKCQIQISAGCAMYPKDGFSHSELNKYADYALQHAKANGKNKIVFFAHEILENKQTSLEILKYLRESVSNNFVGFELAYQPQVDVKTKQIKGAEALLRWQCPQLGRVSPGQFIPILEESNLIVPVGLWVLRQAIEESRPWFEKDPTFSVSVNVSALQLTASDFVEDVKKIIEETHVAPHNLVLELTESYMVRNLSYLQTIFDELRSLGLQIAMDDFGTGYASLGILKTVPADIVKIDQTFVRDIQNSKFDQTFIQFITQICHDIHLKVLLEGIETEEELAVVEPMMLDYIQGYLFGKPLPADEFAKQLEV